MTRRMKWKMREKVEKSRRESRRESSNTQHHERMRMGWSEVRNTPNLSQCQRDIKNVCCEIRDNVTCEVCCTQNR